MGEYSESFVGLDTSKLKTSVAIASGGRNWDVRFFGDIDSRPAATSAMVKELAKPGIDLHFC